MTATVESVNDSMDLTAIASENVVTAMARSVTLSDADVGKDTDWKINVVPIS